MVSTVRSRKRTKTSVPRQRVVPVSLHRRTALQESFPGAPRAVRQEQVSDTPERKAPTDLDPSRGCVLSDDYRLDLRKYKNAAHMHDHTDHFWVQGSIDA